MNGVIEFYQEAQKDYRKALPAGLICRAPIPFRLGVKADRLNLIHIDNKENPKSAEFSLENTDLTDFDPTTAPALRYLNLKSDEFLLSIGYKYRYCIITSDPMPGGSYDSPGENGFMVTPLYSTRNDAGDFKNPPNYEMVLRAQAYQLNNVFYLPESNQFDMKESFARIDRMCFVRFELIFPKPVTLTNKALELLREWTWKSYGFPLDGLDPALDKFRDSASKELDKRLAKAG